MKKLIFILFMGISVTFVNAQELDFSVLFKSPAMSGDCPEIKCIKLPEALEKAKRTNFESRKNALKVYQAREFIKVRLGQILPSFNLKISWPIDLYDYVPNVLGFLFPSNWFRWKESKLYAKAEEYNYLTLISNNVNMVESLYYTIHRETNVVGLIENHLSFIKSFVNLLSLREESGEVPLEILEHAKAFQSTKKIELLHIKNNVQEALNHLGYTIDFQENWKDLRIENIESPKTDSLSPLDPEEFMNEALKKSNELQSLKYMKLATKWSRRARMFDFLTPGSGTDSAFGFGYLSQLRIGKADKELVQIKEEAFQARLKETLYKTASSYNTALELVDESKRGIGSLKIVLEGIVDDFKVSGEINLDDFFGVLERLFYFQWTQNYGNHAILIANAQFERSLLEGKHYSNLETFLPPKKRGHKLGWSKRRENKKINKAISSGELVLP